MSTIISIRQCTENPYDGYCNHEWPTAFGEGTQEERKALICSDCGLPLRCWRCWGEGKTSPAVGVRRCFAVLEAGDDRLLCMRHIREMEAVEAFAKIRQPLSEQISQKTAAAMGVPRRLLTEVEPRDIVVVRDRPRKATDVAREKQLLEARIRGRNKR